MALLLGLYYTVLEREKMHRFNRFYLLAALVTSLVLPFIAIPVYVAAAPGQVQAIIQEPLQEINQVQLQESPQPVVAQPTNYIAYAIWTVYAIITALLAVRFIANIRKLLLLKSNNKNIAYSNATLVLVNADIRPYTFLANIYINKKDYKNRLIEPELFTHELAHVQQGHTLDILFIETLKVLFWFNPLLYLYKRAIQLNHEFLADENTIQKLDLNIPAYQQLLLSKAIPANSFALASSINFSLTKKRFTMMTKTTSKSKSVVLKVAILPALALLIYTISAETVAKQPEWQQVQNGTALKDSTEFKYQRDLYYSNVQILINDKANGIYINKPFEKLTENEKWRYSFSLPDKKYQPKMVPATEFEKFTDKQLYYITIDGNPADNATLAKYTRSDFVNYTVYIKAEEMLTEERPQKFEYYLETAPYFKNKHPKETWGHYPGSIFELNITKIYKDGKVIAPAPDKTPVTEGEYFKGVRFIEYDKEGGKIILDKLYEELTPEDKKRFMPMMFIPKPPVKQSPTATEIKDFLNAEKYAIWIDGKNVPNSELKNYSRTNIAYFTGSVILKHARTKKHPQPFQYWFYTHKYFDAHKMGEVKRHYGGDTITMWLNKAQ
ncbi:M56 family metallopeptidase [Flavobacterium rhizosphaerae]|uniref:M56 family metallopeptidase n=1 Tax=Flavobacterium rhizosphaerae TaxID=3163298 RepID=A0ABW8YYW7_9FLAO